MMMLPPVSYRRAIKGPRRQRGPFPNKFRAESVAKEFLVLRMATKYLVKIKA